MTKRQFTVKHDNPHRAEVCQRAIEEMRQRFRLGQDFEVEVREPKRTLPENALLHALIAELARKVEWAGARRDAEVWKRLLVAAWCRVNGQGVEVLPALDGHGVDIVPARTSRLSKRDCADLIEFVHAWGADQGVRWDAPEGMAA